MLHRDSRFRRHSDRSGHDCHQQGKYMDLSVHLALARATSFALIGAATIATPSVQAETAKPEAVIQLEVIPGAGNALRATVHGHEALFLFDTGEGITTVTPAFARDIGCQPWGQITGFRMSSERLDLQRCDNVTINVAKLPFKAPIAGVFDIMALLPDSKVPLAGSIGLDVFADRTITIEPRTNRVIVESPASVAERTKPAISVPARLVRDAEGVALAIDVGVTTEAGTAWMELDTGNGGTLVIGKHVAALLGLDPEKKEPQSAHFQLSNGPAVTGDARVRDLIMDGNIGQRFWSQWNVTLDLRHGLVWLAPSATP